MKTKIIHIILMLITLQISLAQNEIWPDTICATSDNNPENSSSNGFFDCANTSTWYSDRYLYVPKVIDSPIFIRLNLIFVQDANGEANFAEADEEQLSILNDMVDKLNEIYSSLGEPDDWNSCCVENCYVVPEIKIQFIANYFYLPVSDWSNHNKDLCPDNNQWFDYLDDIVLIDPNIPAGVNVYLTTNQNIYNELIINQTTTDHNSTGLACSQWPSFQDENRTSRIHIPDFFTKWWWMKNIVPFDEEFNPDNFPYNPTIREWDFGSKAHTLAHELGHTLFLSHACEHYDRNECWNSLMHQGGNAPHNYLPPSEIGKMHQAVSLSNVRKFVTAESYNSNPLSFSEDENWDIDIKSYRNLIIEPNTNFTLSCRLLLVENAKIIVKQDGLLEIDEGIITPDYESTNWQGIELQGSNSQFILKPNTNLDIPYGVPIEVKNGSKFIVKNNSTLTFKSGSQLNLFGGSKIIVDAGATLVIQDNVQFLGNGSSNIEVFGNLQIAGTSVHFNNCSIEVKNNGTFTINNGESVLLLAGTDILVEPLGNLAIGSNATVFSSYSSIIDINGNIQVSNGVTFDVITGGGSFGGLILNNQGATVTFNNVTFNNGQLINYSLSLNIENSFINSTYLGSHRGFINIDNTTFDGVWTYFTNTTNPLPFVSLTITDCVLKNESQTGLTIDRYPYFNINNNHIFNCGDGIALFNSGNGSVGNQNILSNVLYNNSSSGISLYNSKATISGNYIHNNLFGVKFFNNSNVALSGNPNATTYDDINFITDNTSYEVYASTGSFPWYFRYNAVIDEDNLGNPTDPMIYYTPPGGGSTLLDVRYNCWGNNFSQAADLYPSGYIVNPTWCPSGGGHKSTDIALDDFMEGLDYFENGQYADARTAFENVINQYPETPYAGSAMHELFALEKYDGNDFNALKQYYQSNDSIQADSVLAKLSDFLANKCEIELQNWQTAIDHYEGIIENPETPEDSIFAIIDLGYTYLLMGDSSYKSTAQGHMLEHKPVSAQAFYNKRDYLLSLLPFGLSDTQDQALFDNSKPGQLLQNIPNPFSNTTTIQFYLNTTDFSNLQLKIFDQIGREIKRIPVENAMEGLNSIEINMQGLSAGIYYYSLFINGKQTDTKKMVIAR